LPNTNKKGGLNVKFWNITYIALSLAFVGAIVFVYYQAKALESLTKKLY